MTDDTPTNPNPQPDTQFGANHPQGDAGNAPRDLRRDALRVELMGVVRARGRRRRAVLAAATTLPLLAIAGVAWLALNPTQSQPPQHAAPTTPIASTTPTDPPALPSPVAPDISDPRITSPGLALAESTEPAESTQPPPTAPTIRRVVLATDDSILDRLATRAVPISRDSAPPPTIRHLSDDDLMGLLSESGYSATLIRSGGQLQFALGARPALPTATVPAAPVDARTPDPVPNPTANPDSNPI